MENKIKLECAVDEAPSQIPTLKFLTPPPPPAPPSPTPGAWSQQQNENSVQYVFYLLFVRTHAKFGIHMIMLEKNIFWPPWAPPASQSPPLGHDQGDRMKILSDMFCIFHSYNTHKVWYKNFWNWHVNQNLMIFDLLTSPQGHQFDPRMKILLAFCSACHPPQFDMPHDNVWKKIFLTPSAPQRPKVWPLGHGPRQ